MLNIEKTKTKLDLSLKHKKLDLDQNDVCYARAYIKDYWHNLIRYHPHDEGSLIGLPNKYLVPSFAEGHEFDYDELFYWDSYFMVQSSWQDKHNQELILGIIDNLCLLFNRFQIIPNSNQYYMTSRSQPPFLSSLIIEAWSNFNLSMDWLESKMEVAQNEYNTVWMGVRKPNVRLVYKGLSRYYDFNYLSDVAEAESGWDMTTRFHRKALNYLPVDLNALLYKYETDFAKVAKLGGKNQEADDWQEAANNRKLMMDELMWDHNKGLFYDYDFIRQKRGTVASLAAYYPMWVGMVSEEQADMLVKSLSRFDVMAGLTTTEFSPSRALIKDSLPVQWAYPNGWAPLHFIVVQALERYGYHKEARRIVNKWLAGNLEWFNNHGVFLEKYNVVNPDKPPVKGLYPSQVGFGWTNAVFERFCQDYIDNKVDVNIF